MSEETTVRMPLTVEERAERADIMAALLAEIAAIERQKAEKAKELGDAIKALEARLQEHGNVLREGAEERRQMDLTFPQEQAAQALHDVAEAACTCEGGPEADVKSPSCPVHGVDSQAPRFVVCDGDHRAPTCGDPDCWLVEGPAEEPEVPEGETLSTVGSGGAEVEADYVAPESNVVDLADARALKAAEVNVGAVEEPAAVRARRRRL